MLDEEATVPNGSDDSFVVKLHAAFASRPALYAKPGLGAARIGTDLGPELSRLQFIVTHYADTVQRTAALHRSPNSTEPRTRTARTAIALLAPLAPLPHPYPHGAPTPTVHPPPRCRCNTRRMRGLRRPAARYLPT